MSTFLNPHATKIEPPSHNLVSTHNTLTTFTMKTGTKGPSALLLILFVSALFPLPGAGSFMGSGSGVCIDSLDFVRTNEQTVIDENAFRTYILCPNTEYNLAEVLHQGEAHSEGQSPLLISKSNVRIQCGEDGSSSNNCILTGGIYQLGFFRVASGGAPNDISISNAFVQGLTFKSSGTFNIMVENRGELTVTDCVFRNNQNISPIFASTTALGSRNLHRLLSGGVGQSGVTAEWIKWQRNEMEREAASSSSQLQLKVTNSIFLVSVALNADLDVVLHLRWPVFSGYDSLKFSSFSYRRTIPCGTAVERRLMVW